MDWLCWIGLGLKLQGRLDIYKGVILSSKKKQLWDFAKKNSYGFDLIPVWSRCMFWASEAHPRDVMTCFDK